MLNWTFETPDIGKIFYLVLLEALLSADNALILAIIVRHLPVDQQRKALMYGLLGAFVLRIGAIFAASVIVSLWWMQVLGAIYLIYLPIKHFVKQGHGPGFSKAAGASFWMTVVYADLADLMFAIDSVLVAVAVEPNPSKIWVIYTGAVLGIVLLRFAAGWCLKLLERYPVLDHVAFLLVGWAGLKMVFLSGHTFEAWYNKNNPNNPLGFHFPELHPAIFWTGLALICIIGTWYAVKHAPSEPEDEQPEALEHASETVNPSEESNSQNQSNT